ncbi:MAG: hypothetical protein LBQ54_14900 [Planctomycetaceae bacterium]|nr:hypothetical protein [Planctomycetaceae bacterium]
MIKIKQRKTETVSLRISIDEKKRLADEAKELKLELAELLRKRILGEENNDLTNKVYELEKRVKIIEEKLK